MKRFPLLRFFCLGLLLQSFFFSVGNASFWDDLFNIVNDENDDQENPNPTPTTRLVSLVPRIGVIGDSISDEYSTYPYGFTALNWVQFLEKSDYGEFGSFRTLRNYPRLYGYEYNWARAGATTSDALAEGQVTGLMHQVANRWVEAAVVFIGGNDFVAVYDSIYDGVWSEAQIDMFVANLTQRLRNIIDSVASMDPNVMVLCTIPDIGDTPAYHFGDRMNDQRRAAVTAVLDRVNNAIRKMATQRDAALFDTCAMLKEIVASPEFRYHGYRIDTTSGGTSNKKLFAIDRFHPGSMLQSHISNTVLKLIDDKRIEMLERVSEMIPGTQLEPEYHLIPPATIFALVGVEPSAEIFFPNSWFTDESHEVIQSPWFGVLAINDFPWINHAEHGWMYCEGYGGEYVRMWDSNLGWLLTNTTDYPWFYRESDGHFLRYELGTSQPQRFYDQTTEQWIEIPYGAFPVELTVKIEI